MYRYRYERGVSRFVLERFNLHRHKLGTITKVKAKRHRATKGHTTKIKGDGFVILRRSTWNNTYETIMVYGTNGTARFSGCSWNYLGEGPRTVHALLKAIGLTDQAADTFAFYAKRGEYNDIGIDWEINLTPADTNRHRLN